MTCGRCSRVGEPVAGEHERLGQLIGEFSVEMLTKLRRKADCGWEGWDSPKETLRLKQRLAIHLVRALDGDSEQWIDVAAFVAFLWWIEQRQSDRTDGQ